MATGINPESHSQKIEYHPPSAQGGNVADGNTEKIVQTTQKIFEQSSPQSPLDSKISFQATPANILPSDRGRLGFVFLKCLAAGVVALVLAGLVAKFCAIVAVALVCISIWLLWTTLIIVMNHLANNTCMEKVFHWIHALTMEINAGIVSAWLFPLTLFKCYLNPQGPSEGPVIILINGYLSFASTFHYLRKRFVDAKLGTIYSINIGSFGSIKTYAEKLQKIVQDIGKKLGKNREFIFVCHSKGGLVGSYYATKLAAQDQIRVTDVITIGSPFAGTPMARCGPGRDAREMEPDHAFNRDLREDMAKHPEICFRHIASLTDEVVPFHSALNGNDPSRHRVIKDVGHLGLVYSEKTADQVCSWIQSRPKNLS